MTRFSWVLVLQLWFINKVRLVVKLDLQNHRLLLVLCFEKSFYLHLKWNLIWFYLQSDIVSDCVAFIVHCRFQMHPHISVTMFVPIFIKTPSLWQIMKRNWKKYGGPSFQESVTEAGIVVANGEGKKKVIISLDVLYMCIMYNKPAQMSYPCKWKCTMIQEVWKRWASWQWDT